MTQDQSPSPTAPAAGDEVAPLPCPFCGSTAISFHNTGVGWCCCDDCRAEGPVRGDEADAITAWNTRPTPPPSSDGDAVRVAVLEALRSLAGQIDREVSCGDWSRPVTIGLQQAAAMVRSKIAVAEFRAALAAPATRPEGEDRSGCRAPQGEPCTCATPHPAPGGTS